MNLLWDSVRKAIQLTSCFFIKNKLRGWRQWEYQLKEIKKSFRRCQKTRYSNSKDLQKKEQHQALIIGLYESYLSCVGKQISKIEKDLQNTIKPISVASSLLIQKYIVHAKRQMEQIKRRIIQGETIAHHEKVFSIFEEHTEWIVKGKAGVAQELGLLVNVVKDQFGFILHHKVMQQQKDIHVAVEVINETKKNFPNLKSCSFDKGYYSPANKEDLERILDWVILPKKGRLSKQEQKVESAPEFKKFRKKHSAVEAAISALENHGLDKCPDHGCAGFKRYIAFAVVARNIQHLGHHLQKKKNRQKARMLIKKAA